MNRILFHLRIPSANRLCRPFSKQTVHTLSNNGAAIHSNRFLNGFKQKSGQCYIIQARFSSSTGLPEPIEQQCQKWERILEAELGAEKGKHKWMGYKLGFNKMFINMKTSRLVLHTNHLTRGQIKVLRTFRNGTPVEIRPEGNSSKLSYGNLLGIVHKHFDDGICIALDRRLDLEEEKQRKECIFDIRETVNIKNFESKMKFLAARNEDWNKMPGYKAMEIAFKCEPLPEPGLDPVEWIGKKMNLDQSQLKALGAALNPQRPILAIHGPPGSGKTRMLADYLKVVEKQGKRVLVMSCSPPGLYHSAAEFCKITDGKGNFHCLRKFDEKLASKIIIDPAIRGLIEKNTFDKMPSHYLGNFTRKMYRNTETLQNQFEIIKEEGEGKSRYSKEELEKAERLTQQGRERGHELNAAEQKKLIEGKAVIFTTMSRSTINIFMRNGITFDVVVLDGAQHVNEFSAWWMTTPVAPIVRLFGDYNQPGVPLHSQIAYDHDFGKSLIQRLDEQFGPEVNMHLGRQYRSNPAIQEWPNRVFYRERAAEPDESVQNISLNDLVEEGKEKPKNLIMDPLVLVDLGRLEGEWREWMFTPEKGGRSWYNWGEAFLVAEHLHHLFDHLPLCQPHEMAYFTLFGAQRLKIGDIYSDFLPQYLPKLEGVCMDPSHSVQDQQVEIVLKSHIISPSQKCMPADNLFDPFDLKHLAFEMGRARRQFIYFANSEWLEKGSAESRQLLDTFVKKGRIVGPNELLPLGEGKLGKMKKDAEEWYRQHRRPKDPNWKYAINSDIYRFNS